MARATDTGTPPVPAGPAFDPAARLTRRQDFLDLARAQKAVMRGFILQAGRQADAEAPPRTGFTVSRKVGDAVARNRVRRRLKEAMRAVGPDGARRGFDYVLVGRRAALTLSYADLLTDLRSAFIKVHRPRRAPAGKRQANQATSQRDGKRA